MRGMQRDHEVRVLAAHLQRKFGCTRSDAFDIILAMSPEERHQQRFKVMSYYIVSKKGGSRGHR